MSNVDFSRAKVFFKPVQDVLCFPPKDYRRETPAPRDAKLFIVKKMLLMIGLMNKARQEQTLCPFEAAKKRALKYIIQSDLLSKTPIFPQFHTDNNNIGVFFYAKPLAESK